MTSPTPVTPPTSATSVAGHLEWDDASDEALERLGPYVAAANALVRRLHEPRPDTGEYDDDFALGARMLAARLYKRRKSAEGVMAQFSVEGPVYVQRNDPDVAMLLQLGSWARPVVG